METKSIDALFASQAEQWKTYNQELFGVSSVDTLDEDKISKSLERDAETYWNKGTCDLKKHLIDDKRLNEADRMLLGTWNLQYNKNTTTIGIFASFLLGATLNDKPLKKSQLVELRQELDELSQGVRENLSDKFKDINTDDLDIQVKCVAYIPLIDELSYKIKNTNYALRTQAYPAAALIKKIKGVVKYKDYGYKDNEFINGFNFFDELDNNSKELLSAVIREPLTKDNLLKALSALPEYNPQDVAYFRFRWFSAIRTLVMGSNRTAAIAKNRPISYAQLLLSFAKYKKTNLADVRCNLIIVESLIRALEVTRQVIYPAPTFHNTFAFQIECGGGGGLKGISPFDAFKTQQSKKTAGRTRSLLDFIKVKNDDKLEFDYKGKTYNQYDLEFANVPKEILETSNISVLTQTPFNFLNDPKRLMLAHKLRAQAVPVKSEISKLTHEIPARVVFADLSGFSVGDSLIISESFAKKLETTHIEKIEVKDAPDYFEVGQRLEQKDLIELEQKNRFSDWQDIEVIEIAQDFFIVKARVPFGVGDKVTNLHASKGIVSIILPDEKMPRLKNDLSKNMKAGPIDIVVPGISIFKRKSVAQIFEAEAMALGLDFTIEALEKDQKKLQEYDKNSIFEFEGKEFQAPCGVQVFLRLKHDASTKQTFSWLKSNTDYALHFGEQEQTNLYARGKTKIAAELDTRSVTKHKRSLAQIKQMQENHSFAPTIAEPEGLDTYMKLLGFEMNYKELTKDDVDERFWQLFDVIDNKQIELW